MPGTTPRQLAGPTPAGVAVLALAAIALLATSAPLPTLHSQVVGEAALSPGETVERELRIHLDPEAGPPSLARVSVGFESSIGLSRSYTDQATAELTEAHDAFGSFPVDEDASPRCAEGCDLVYRIDLRAGPDVLPASVARYTADVEFQFRSGPYPDAAWLTTELDGAASGPPSPLWAFLAGVVGLVAGIAAGPAVARRLGPAWPRRSTIALIVLLLAPLVWLYVTRLVSLLAVWDQLRLGSPLYVLFLVDPWSIALLGTLAWGLWRGFHRRDVDGGWLLGLAAVATVGLAGLWLGDLVGEAAIVQPLVAALAFAVLGGLGGLIIGQAWRTDARAWHDRGWAAAAVLSHGVVIAGFGFLAMNAMYERIRERQRLPAARPARRGGGPVPALVPRRPRGAHPGRPDHRRAGGAGRLRDRVRHDIGRRHQLTVRAREPGGDDRDGRVDRGARDGVLPDAPAGRIDRRRRRRRSPRAPDRAPGGFSPPRAARRR